MYSPRLCFAVIITLVALNYTVAEANALKEVFFTSRSVGVIHIGNHGNYMEDD